MIKNRNKVIAFNIASTIILQGLAFISGPIFSHALGTDNYGIASVYLTWVTLASTIFSLQAGGTVAIARVNFPPEDQVHYQSSVLSLATTAYTGFSMMTILVCFVGRSWVDINIPMIVVGLLHGWGLYCVNFMNLKLTYEFKANLNFILSVTVSVLTIGISLLLIHSLPSETNYWGRIIGQAVVYTIIGLILYLYIISKGKVFYNKTFWKFTLPISIPTVFHLLANLILGQSDRVMLQSMDSNSAAGIYALSSTFGMVLFTIYSALNNSWVPFYYDYTANKQIEEIRKHARNYIELFTILTVGFILLAKEVFHIYAAKSFWRGTDLIPLFSLGNYFVFLYSFPVNYEFYHKKTAMIAIGTSCAAVCNIILNFFFIRRLGIYGAIIATTVSHGFQFGFHYIFAKRIGAGGFPFSMGDFIPWFLVVCVACIVYYLTSDLWIIRWGISVIMGTYLLIRIIKRKEVF